VGKADPGGDDADAARADKVACRDKLRRLADPRLVGEKRAGAGGEELGAGLLERLKLHAARRG
jgi:hypothetical protein